MIAVAVLAAGSALVVAAFAWAMCRAAADADRWATMHDPQSETWWAELDRMEDA